MSHSDLRQILADWLEQALEEKGWSQAELARRAKPSRQTISRIATKAGDTDAETLQELAKVLEKPLPESIRDEAGTSYWLKAAPPAQLKIVASPPTIGTGPDPRTVRASRTAELLGGTADDAKQLLASGNLDDAVQRMWRGIQAAERELRGDERRRPRVTRAEVDRRKRDVDGSDG